MKRCPQCNRVETDTTLTYCRTDGALLMTDSAITSDEAQTRTLQIVNVSDGAQLWGGRYNRKATDLLAVQEEIAREVVELRVRLSNEERDRLTKRYTENIAHTVLI